MITGRVADSDLDGGKQREIAIGRPKLAHAVVGTDRGDAQRPGYWCRRQSRAAAAINLVADIDPTGVAERLRQSTAAVNRKIEAHSFPARANAQRVLQPFLDQRVQRRTLGPGDLPGLFHETVRQLDRRFQMGVP